MGSEIRYALYYKNITFWQSRRLLSRIRQIAKDWGLEGGYTQQLTFTLCFITKKNMIRNRSGVLKVSSCLALKEKNKNKHKINVLGIDVYISLLVRGQSRKTSCKPWLHVGKFRESWSRVRQKLLSHAFTPQWTQGACNFSYCVWDEKREMS